MLEQYFFKPETVDQIRSSWLGEPIERYVIWLSSQDYAPNHSRSAPSACRCRCGAARGSPPACPIHGGYAGLPGAASCSEPNRRHATSRVRSDV